MLITLACPSFFCVKQKAGEIYSRARRFAGKNVHASRGPCNQEISELRLIKRDDNLNKIIGPKVMQKKCGCAPCDRLYELE